MQSFYQYYEQCLDSDSSQEAIVPPKHYDVIILDLSMPIMDGYEACKRIIELYD